MSSEHSLFIRSKSCTVIVNLRSLFKIIVEIGMKNFGSKFENKLKNF